MTALITNLGGLKTVALSYAKRSTNQVANLDDMVALADQRIRFGFGDEGNPMFSEPVRVKEMIDASTPVTLTQNVDYASLPSGFLEYIEAPYLELASGEKHPLEYQAPTVLVATESMNTARRPYYYTIKGDRVYFPAPADSSYTMRGQFYKLAALTNDTDTNTLLTSHPSIYLSALLLEIAEYIGNDTLVARQLAKFKGAVQAAIRQNFMRAAMGQALVPRLDFVAP